MPQLTRDVLDAEREQLQQSPVNALQNGPFTGCAVKLDQLLLQIVIQIKE